MKKLLLAGLLCVPLWFTGCATVDQGPPILLTGDILVDGPNAIAHGHARDKVLWEYRTAVGAMRAGNYGLAKGYLDDALTAIGGVYGKDATAKEARSYFHGEEKKKFIGEPYERVMAYYYRGILYWMDGEPDNARACFKSAQIEDSSAEQQYNSDYILLDYLDGLATVKQSGDGSDALNRVIKLRSPYPKPPAYDPRANVLFFLEFGQGPTKYATGSYQEELRFRVTPSRVKSAVVRVEDQALALGPYDDLDFQATTRGGRVMDHVLANKAVFKTTTDIVGTAAIASGAILAATDHSDAGLGIGLGLVAAGVVSKIISSATTPAADTRSWDNLPHYLSFAALRLAPGQHTATVEFRDPTGYTLPNLTKTITLNVPADPHDVVVYVSDRSQTPQTR